MRAELRALGVPEEQLTEIGPTPDEPITVWPANWPVVRLFLALSTQWRIATGLGPVVWLGLRYTEADVLMRREPAFATVDFADLRLMETAALAILNTRS